MKSVKSAKWCPTRNVLAICTGLHHVYLWNPEVRTPPPAPSCSLSRLGRKTVSSPLPHLFALETCYAWNRVDLTWHRPGVTRESMPARQVREGGEAVVPFARVHETRT